MFYSEEKLEWCLLCSEEMYTQYTYSTVRMLVDVLDLVFQ